MKPHKHEKTCFIGVVDPEGPAEFLRVQLYVTDEGETALRIEATYRDSHEYKAVGAAVVKPILILGEPTDPSYWTGARQCFTASIRQEDGAVWDMIQAFACERDLVIRH